MPQITPFDAFRLLVGHTEHAIACAQNLETFLWCRHTILDE